MIKSLEERISEKFQINHETGCWEWTGSLSHLGYSQIKRDGRADKAHRATWETFVSSIPEQMKLDHLCRNRKCINPDHLEIVTQRENVLRGNGIAAKEAKQTHCIHGHEFTIENTYLRPNNGGRRCKVCKRINDKKAKNVNDPRWAQMGIQTVQEWPWKI